MTTRSGHSHGLITQFAPLRAVFSLAFRAAPDLPAVIRGEPGTGKTLLARALRRMSVSRLVIEEGSAATPARGQPVGLVVDLPPLRERVVDIPLLAEHFARRAVQARVRFSDETVTRLQQRPWPGNVTELRDVVLEAVSCADRHGSYYIVCGF